MDVRSAPPWSGDDVAPHWRSNENALSLHPGLVYISAMRIAFAFFVAGMLGFGADRLPKQPESLVFPSKSGKVVFNHAAHLARQNGSCVFCHPKLWPQSVKAPVRSGVTCGACHLRGGRAFAMKGNCGRCHEGGAGQSPSRPTVPGDRAEQMRRNRQNRS